jgi:ABC-type glycerol-3-phosphate transport system substrate-binding protein
VLTRRQFLAGALKRGLPASAAAGLLAACHPKGRPAARAPLQGRVQILVGFDGGNTAPERQVQQSLAGAFIAAHPQVGVDFLRASSAAAAQDQLQALVARGSAPDIVLGIGLDSLATLVDQHRWLDLRPLVRRDGISTGSFLSQAMSASALQDYYGSTGALPGLPIGVHDHALAYNEALFTKAGVSPPPPSWTDRSWAYSGSFLQAAQSLTLDSGGRHAGQAGFDATKVTQYGVARLAPETVYFNFGGNIYDRSKRRALFDTPSAVQAAQFVGDLTGKYQVLPTAAQLAKVAGPAAGGAAGGASPAGAGATDDQAAQAAWRAGKVAMIDLCSCEINSPFGLQVPFAWKAADLPAGPSRRFAPLEVSLGAIVAASKQHDLAWEVLKFFAVDPGHERDLAYGGFNAMPGLNANSDAFTQGVKALGVDPTVWVSGRGTASADHDRWVPAFADIHTSLGNAFTAVAMGTPAATAMGQLQQQAQAKIDAWFRSNKLPH